MKINIMKAFILIFFGRSIAIDALNTDPMLQAQAYFEAEDYDQAANIYNGLLQQDLPSWQKNIVLYDLGTTQLSGGELDESIKEFRQALIQKSSSPLFVRNLKINYALASLREGLQILSTKSEKTQFKYEQSIFNFQLALNLLNEAQSANCELSKLEQDAQCTSENNISEMHALIKMHLNNTLQDYKTFQLSKTSVNFGSSQLLSSLYFFQNWIDFLQKKNLTEKQKNEYFAAIEQELFTWEPLWNDQEVKVKRELKDSGVQQMFYEAKKAYLNALSSLKREDLKSTKDYLETSIDALKKFLQTFLKNVDASELFKNLSQLYDQVLLQTPLQMPALLQLQSEQTQIEISVGDKKKSSELKKIITNADKDLKQSLQLIEQSKDNLAKLFLQDGKEWIQRALQSLEKSKDKASVKSLKNIISDEQYAIQLNNNRQQLDVDKDNAQLANNLVSDAQTQTNTNADTFLPIVFAEQNALFQGKDLNLACQCKPWDAVLPLFNEGLDQANKAQSLLKQDTKLAIPFQEQALKLWKEALEKLKAGVSAQQKKAEQDKNSPNEKTNVPKIAPPTSTNDILRTIQEMDHMDQRPQKPGNVKKGDKPW